VDLLQEAAVGWAMNAVAFGAFAMLESRYPRL